MLQQETIQNLTLNMTIIVRYPFQNPYRNCLDYTPVEVEKNVIYQGNKYDLRLTYESKLSPLERLIASVLVLASRFTLLPLFFAKEAVDHCYNRAITGVDRQVVVIEEASAVLNKKRVRFDMTPHIRYFHTDTDLNVYQFKRALLNF